MPPNTSFQAFSSLTIDKLKQQFGLKEVDNLIFKFKFGENIDTQSLQNLIQKSKRRIQYWNEQELVIKFLSRVLELADLQGDGYSTFAEREFSAVVDGFGLIGKTDFVVAKGETIPSKPYFFIQEYKRAKLGPESDPLAQLLGEMLVAQKLNNSNTVYGSYIVGQLWYFVVLSDRDFTISSAFDSMQIDELLGIMSRLNWIKEYVEKELENSE